MTNEEMQEALRAPFRAQELQRREARRKILLNHEALEHEKLNAVDQKAHDEAIKALKEGQLRYEKESSPGYWQRLWRALRNR